MEPAHLDGLLATHGIDARAIREDDFDGFFESREGWLKDRMNWVLATGMPYVSARASDTLTGMRKD
jgi:hypothetical protein